MTAHTNCSADTSDMALPEPPSRPSPPEEQPIEEPPEESWEDYLDRIGQDPDIVMPEPQPPEEPGDPDNPDA